ncbi:Hypothetical_protein [Hexamita inflata]|uniref:Hypothetical_protein n=1 Tax=Hexamita inflata TaxID=28002 RepID=A0AA86PI27_9EUKA|nr:Hypothetical protein HINF_LOCUS25253 [Hexamita inflata]
MSIQQKLQERNLYEQGLQYSNQFLKTYIPASSPPLKPHYRTELPCCSAKQNSHTVNQDQFKNSFIKITDTPSPNFYLLSVPKPKQKSILSSPRPRSVFDQIALSNDFKLSPNQFTVNYTHKNDIYPKMKRFTEKKCKQSGTTFYSPKIIRTKLDVKIKEKTDNFKIKDDTWIGPGYYKVKWNGVGKSTERVQ